MAVKISSIQIQKLGPLSSLKADLGMLNLIYGKNESGKTYLVEFLLQSIFRHAKTWKLRDINPEGAVHLQGLNKETTIFSPTSSRKIEDYWQENERGLPLNMARLLVVKGGELALAGSSPGGVNREILKNILTSQALLDQIRDRIQPTVRKAEIIDQKIIGKNQGQLNDRNTLQNRLQDIDNLLNSIEEKYSRGPARQIEDQIEISEKQLIQQINAKRHQAYLLSNEQEELRLKREKISDDSLLSLRDRVRDHKKLKSDLESLNKKIISSQSDVETYHWLKSAREIWEEKDLETKMLPEKILVVIGGVLLTIGLITTVLQNIFSWEYFFWGGIIAALIGGLVFAYFGIQLLNGTKNAADSAERNAIRIAYKEKFNQSLNGITGLKAQQSRFQEIYIKTKSMQEERSNLEIKLEKEQEYITVAFQELIGDTISINGWETNLDNFKNQAATLDSEFSDLAIKLAKLNVNEDEFLSEGNEIVYDPQAQADIEDHLSNLEDELISHKTNLDTLKARAIEWTRDEISAPWIEVLHHLRTMRNDIKQSFINLTAEIAAKIGLSEILSKIEEEEDQKILENINTKDVTNLMENITVKYNSLNLIEDQIYVRDAFQDYALQDLSTGAREQVQLALRLGIASHISGGEPLFVILDDAFQHSDWNRRKSLVQATVDLAKTGWQVFYLTMDDHIRDLYLEIGKSELKKNFKSFEL